MLDGKTDLEKFTNGDKIWTLVCHSKKKETANYSKNPYTMCL